MHSEPEQQEKISRISRFTAGGINRYVLLPLLFVGAALLGAALYVILFPAPAPRSDSDIDDLIVEAMASATPPSAYSAQVYETILPSLVLIQIERAGGGDDEGRGVGGGVVVNEAGQILTALHVVEDAEVIEVYYADGTKSTADITAAEPEKDIAVLAPHQLPEILVPAVLGSAGAMRVGDEAFAVGNPLGLAASLSAGVISGFDRSIPVRDEERRLEGLIQFDAAVNPGNSGGPLLNRYGQVVGIVTALANPYDQNTFVGIGFAVPIGTAVSVAGGVSY